LNNVLVIREENGQRKTFRVDLSNVSFYKSPVFQLQQNDILYVSAKDSKYREKAMNEVNMRSNIILKYLSFFNVAVGVVLLVTTLTK
jgi:polysaccharide export outer membrane protein